MLFKTRYDLPSWDFNAVSLERITGLLHCVCVRVCAGWQVTPSHSGIGPGIWGHPGPYQSQVTLRSLQIQHTCRGPEYNSTDLYSGRSRTKGLPGARAMGSLWSAVLDSLTVCISSIYLNSLGFRKLPSADLLMQSQVDHCLLHPSLKV